MKRIFAYQLPVDQPDVIQEILMPSGSKILSACALEDNVVVYAEVHDEVALRPRKLVAVMTSSTPPANCPKFVGTIPSGAVNTFALHVYSD